MKLTVPFLGPGPFGAWGRKLGFRWIFPIGTMPVPFHPLLLPLALTGLCAWAGLSAYNAALNLAGGGTWAQFLALGLLVGVALSIPILCWMAFALGGLLVQGVLFALAMALLALDVATGRASLILGVLPAGYVLLFAVQTLLGKAWLRRIERESLTIPPPGQAAFALTAFEHDAKWLIQHYDLVRLYCPAGRGSRDRTTMLHWLAAEDADAIERAWGRRAPEGWKLTPLTGGTLLARPCEITPPEAIILSQGKLRTPLWLVTGMRTISARGPGQAWRFVHGGAQTVLPIPLFHLFRFTSLLSPGSNHLSIGFPRRKLRDLPGPDLHGVRAFSAILPSRGNEGGLHDKAGLADLHALIGAHNRALADERARTVASLPAFWTQLGTLLVPSTAERAAIELLIEEPDLLDSDKVPIVLDWTDRTIEKRMQFALFAAARLLAAFSDDQLLPHAERLHERFNSRKLALQWQLGKDFDIASLPKKTPIFRGIVAGYGLFVVNPALYEKLARIDSRMERAVNGLNHQIDSGEPGLSRRFIAVR